MSTKIYEAWRFPKTRLNEFLTIARETMFKNAWKRMRVLMSAVKQEVVDQKMKDLSRRMGDGFSKLPKHRVERLKKRQRWELILEQIKEASKSSERSPLFCFDCSLNLWIHGRYVYAIPHGEGFLREGLRFPKWTEEYAYWNNVDHPKGISRRQWEERGRMWDKVCLDDWNDFRLQHDVVSFRPSECVSSIVKFELALGCNLF